MKSILFLCCLLLSGTAFSQGQRIYVHVAAAGNHTGQSWSNAYNDLQDALHAALAGDTIWVATGTYFPTPSTDRSISFEPVSGVRIFGGFKGTETALSQRDWVAQPTILSGDIGLPGDSLDNSYNVMYMLQPDSNTVLDGLIFRDGVANEPAAMAASDTQAVRGGGLLVDAAYGPIYVEIRNCRFEHNAAEAYGAGACIGLHAGFEPGSIQPRLINCIFENNRTPKFAYGGGLALFGSGQISRGPTIDSCTFIHNWAGTNGGAIYYFNEYGTDNLIIQNSRFEDNYAGTFGGGIHMITGRVDTGRIIIKNTIFNADTAVGGSALYIQNNNGVFNGTITIEQCNFQYNASINANGEVIQTMVSTTPQSKLNIIENTFKENTTGSSIIGGSFSGTQKIENTIFEHNTTASIIHLVFNNHIIKNCKFSNNILSNGSIARHSKVKKVRYVNCLINDNQGPLLFFYNYFSDTCILENCTLYNNGSAPNFIGPALKQLFINNTFIDTASGEDFLYSGDCAVHLSDCHWNGFDCAAQPSNVVCQGNTSTTGDALFVDPLNGDFRLQPCSPLVNAGNNALLDSINTADLAEMPRRQGGRVDIGAYETAPPQLVVAPLVSAACSGVANGSVSLVPISGCAPYQVHWSNAGSTGQHIDHLFAGTYLFTISDAQGSSFTFPITIPENAGPQLQPESSPVVCGDTLGGSATVQIGTGTPPFSFQWPGSTDSLLTQLPVGNYPVTVTDANGCSANAIVWVGKTGGLQIDVDVVNVSCYGSADGSLTVIPLNGQAPFYWNWENGPATPTNAPLSPGIYSGIVTDALGCNLPYVLPVSQPDSLSFDAAVTFASDSLAGDGSIQLNPISGGTPPYTVTWNTGQTGLAIPDLQPGIYTASVTDVHGCSKTGSYSIGTVSSTDGSATRLPITLFPNPADQVVHMQGEGNSAMLSLTIWNVLGQPIWRQTGGSLLTDIEVHLWPDGLYHLVLTDGKTVWRGLLIIQH